MIENKEIVLENLKEFIKDINLTQKELAKEIKVSQNSVYNWCKGRPISVKGFEKIVEFCVTDKEKYSKLVKEYPFILKNPTLVESLQNKLVVYENNIKEVRKKLQEEKKRVRHLEKENKKLKLLKLVIESKDEIRNSCQKCLGGIREIADDLLEVMDICITSLVGEFLDKIDFAKYFKIDSGFVSDFLYEANNYALKDFSKTIDRFKKDKVIYNEFVREFIKCLGAHCAIAIVDIIYKDDDKIFKEIKRKMLGVYYDIVELMGGTIYKIKKNNELIWEEVEQLIIEIKNM